MEKVHDFFEGCYSFKSLKNQFERKTISTVTSNMKHLKIHSLLIGLIAFVFLFTSCESNTSTSEPNTVNPVIGDASWVLQFGAKPEINSDEFTRVQTHLKYVEELLRSKDVSQLDEQKKSMRFRLLDLLHDYWKNGQFPKNTKYKDERKPCFIDDQGTICAVGYLIEQTAGRNFAEKINNLFQYSTISEMKLPELSAWITKSGLTTEEIATIQPSYNYQYVQPERAVIIGGGMAARGLGAGYPSFVIGIDKYKNSFQSTYLLRYESLGPQDNFLGLRFGFGMRAIRNHSIGAGITPSFFLDNNKSGFNIKPDLAITLLSEAGSKGHIGLMLSYGYDIAVSNKDIFPVSRHDLALHLLFRLGKGRIYRDY
jgi:hypothetical protein